MADLPNGDDGSNGPNKIEEIGGKISSIVRAHPILIVGLLSIAAFVWVMRPWFQPIYYYLRFQLFGTVVYAVLTGVVGLGAKAAFSSGRNKIGYPLGALAVILLLVTMISPMAAGVYVDEDLSERTNMQTGEMGVQNFSQSPAIETDNTRTLTFKGAETQASTSFNKPTHALTDGELVMHDGQLSTSYAQQPEGLYKTFTRQQAGAVFVNINSQNPEVKEVNQKFKCGRGMLIFDDVTYKMQKNNMNTILTNPTTFQGNDGELYNMYSGVQHEIRFGTDNLIPMFYAVPEFSSVHLSDTECNQERLTPEEALNDPRMDGEQKQQFYPYSLMRQEVIATNLQNGWLNTITDKEGMKEYPNVNSIDNRPPYTLMNEDGEYMQVLTMEAIGSGTGVFEVYVGDGRTGEKTKYDFNTTKKGPGYAVNAVITADSERFAEGGGEGSDKLTVSEVYPVFRNGKLWYQVNAVQTGTGIYGYTAFYNPDDGTLLKAYTDAQVEAFYEGSNADNERPENEIDAGEQAGDERTVENPTLWVVIEDDDGNTYTVPVGSGENVNVAQEDPNEDDDESGNSTDTSG